MPEPISTDRPAVPGPDHGREPRVRVLPLATLFVWGAALVLFLRFFDVFKTVLLGLLAAAAMASALRPLVRIAPGPRGLKAILIGLAPPVLFCALIVLAAWQMAAPIRRQLGQLPQMERQINSVLASWSERLGIAQPIQVRDALDRMGGSLTPATGTKIVSRTTNIISDLLLAAVFIFIGSIYLLVDHPRRLLEPVLDLLPPRRRPQVLAALTELGPSLRWWLIGTIIGATTIGVAALIGYWVVGLQFTIPLAILAGLGELVPTIGPLVTLLIALIFAATQGAGTVIGVTVVYLIIQGLESYVLIPMVMKKAVDVPPVVTLFTLVFWGMIFGLPGLLLAIPLDLVVWTFARHLLAPQVIPASE